MTLDSRCQVRGHDADEVAGGDDLGRFQIGREVPAIAGDEVVGFLGGFGVFKELVVVWIACGPNGASWCYDMPLVPDELEQLLAEPFADFQFRASKNRSVSNGLGRSVICVVVTACAATTPPRNPSAPGSAGT